MDLIHADNVKQGRDKYKTLKVQLSYYRISLISLTLAGLTDFFFLFWIKLEILNVSMESLDTYYFNTWLGTIDLHNQAYRYEKNLVLPVIKTELRLARNALIIELKKRKKNSIF